MRVCPYCGQPVPLGEKQGAAPQGGVPQPAGQAAGGYPKTRAKIDNIFSSLIQDRTPGSIMEFSLWCSVCLGVLLLFLAAILTGSDPDDSIAFRLLWIFMMLFSMGLGTLMVFRKFKPLMLFAAQIALQFIMLIVYFCIMLGRILYVGDILLGDSGMDGIAFVVVLFIFTLLCAMGTTACKCVHNFSRLDLGRVISILSIVYSGLLFVFMLVLYFCPSCEHNDKVYYMFGEKVKGWQQSCFWLGSIAFLIVSAAITVYTVLFFKGIIDNQKYKIGSMMPAGGAMNGVQYGQAPQSRIPQPQVQTAQPVPQPQSAQAPMIQGIKGSYQGQVFYLQNTELSIGSQQGVSLVIADPYISHIHCTIRFNSETGMYEVNDQSANGVYLLNGFRLQKGVYMALQRGTVVCLGSVNQQFQLL